MEPAVFNGVLADLGPLIEAGAITALDDDAFWTIEFEDESPLYLEQSEREKHLIVSGEVAELPGQGRAEIYELLLMYNDQAPRTGGARFAIDGPGGAVVLSIDLFAEGLEVNGLAALLQDFRELRRTWRGIVADWPAKREEAVGASPDAGAFPGVRV